MTDAKQTPLTELLRRAPRDMSILHESPDQQGTMSTAVGRLMHEAADEIERLTANIKKANDQAEHFEREWYLRGDEIERLRAERDELRDVLLRGGFVPCDIPACNCGSWHHRYGLPERMQEIKDELAEAGHELSNANGNLTLNALKALVAERDELRRQLAEAELDARRYRWLAGHCRSTSEHWGGRWSIIVDGPCPTAHDEEDAFDAAIVAAMRKEIRSV